MYLTLCTGIWWVEGYENHQSQVEKVLESIEVVLFRLGPWDLRNVIPEDQELLKYEDINPLNQDHQSGYNDFVSIELCLGILCLDHRQ